MSRRARFEIVRTTAGWHARFRASNGQVVWTTEVYERRRAAENACTLVAHSFWCNAAWNEDQICVDKYMRVGVEVREVDER